MAKIDKLIVTNVQALRGKYRTRGLAEIGAAVDAMIAADAARGLATRLIDLSSRSQMRAVRAKAVLDPDVRKANKDAIDAAYRALMPDYLVILGSVDVVPHQSLLNPLYSTDPDGDNDFSVGSDLPYACEAPYSRNIRDFRGPTRVVGRLPDVTGAKDPRFLVRLLGTATHYQTRPRQADDPYFGLSARVWRASTALSLRTMFGSDSAMHQSPTEGPRWSAAQLRGKIHFINCHGAPAEPEFYGQRTSNSNDFPVAHDTKHVQGRIRNGTVAAAECCYGAELYDPSDAEGRYGICYAYLDSGAYGFFGSSTIAYGPSSGNGFADLLCRYFIEGVLRGASLGRAVLEARHTYLLGMSSLQPEDLKTIAQFNLLGDPSIHPIGRVPQALELTKIFQRALADAGLLPPGRGLRRDRLLRTGLLLSDTLGSVRHAPRLRPSATVKEALQASAREAGIPTRRLRLSSFAVRDPAAGRIYRRARLERAPPATVHTVSGTLPRKDGVRRIVVVSARVERGRIVRLRRLHSR
jgi:hypothetical protein